MIGQNIYDILEHGHAIETHAHCSLLQDLGATLIDIHATIIIII